MAEATRNEFDPLQEKILDFSTETHDFGTTKKKESDRSFPSSDLSKEKFESTQKPVVENENRSIVDTVKLKAAEAYNYVASVGGDGESRGFVGAMKEKATGAYNYVAEKVSEATHVVTGDPNKDPNKDPAKETGFSIASRVSAAVEAVKDKAIEVKSEVLK